MATQLVEDIDFSRIDVLGNRLLPELDRVREEVPLMFSESLGAWLVTRHEQVLEAFSGERPLSNKRFSGAAFPSIPLAEQPKRIPHVIGEAPEWIVNNDPPEQTRMRKLMTRAFSRKVVEGLRPFAQTTIERILSEVKTDEPIDFVDAVARAITGRVILHLFGLPDSVLANFKSWSYALNSTFGVANPSPEMLDLGEQAIKELFAAVRPEIEARRKQPTEDFLSQLVHARDGDDLLSEQEMLGICLVALIAGHDTTLNSMALGVDLLVRNPDQIRYLLDHPDDIVNSVVEVTRLSAMSTAQPRIVKADFEWCGEQLKKGELVFVMIAAANRDPRAFADPLRLDLSRATDTVATFGPGLHHCIGHQLAKMQLGEFFTRFFKRFEVELLDEDLRFIPSLAFRGLDTMFVRLTPVP